MHDSSSHQAMTRTSEIEATLVVDPGRFRVLTGDRPTGALHLGHYFGTLASPLELTGLYTARDPAEIAAGLDGAAGLKALTTEAVNERLWSLRARRREPAADPGYPLGVLAAGDAHASALAEATLDRVRVAMGTVYR